jgi:hypothetical protein
MPVPQDEYRICPNCGLRWKVWHFPEPLPDEPEDEFSRWCLPCLRAEARSSHDSAGMSKS